MATPPDRPAPVGLLRDRVVVVAGYGSGLGAALATRSAEEGARVVLASRTQATLDEAVATLTGAGHQAVAVATDVEDEDACEALVERTLAAYGRVDVLLNNAFRMPPMDPLTQVDHQKIRRALDVNVLAALRLTTVFADALEKTQGNVVMVNSGVLWQSQPEYAAYKLTKGAMLHMAQSLATELGPRGIRVNSIAPSYIYEDVNKAYFDWLASERGVTHADVYGEKAALNDLRRLASADEVADAALLLASPYAATVTGVCLDASCGEFHR
jgi:NAD(P)-dependent dehydrogenase (short-subunit alcohol dehydrogenase family)